MKNLLEINENQAKLQLPLPGRTPVRIKPCHSNKNKQQILQMMA